MQFCRGVLLLATTLAAFGLGGCVSAHKLDQALAIPVGMNEVQVANKIGQPVIKDRREDGTERWIWSRKGQFGPESVTLVMQDGRVAAVESEGERIEHLKEIRELDAVLEGRRPATNLVLRPAGSIRSQSVGPVRRELPSTRAADGSGRPAAIQTNGIAEIIAAPPTVKHEKSSEQIWREQEKAHAEAQQQARIVEEHLRELVTRARESEKAAAARAQAINAEEPPLEAPPFTAWYIARQHVVEQLENERPGLKRKLFPNPRFTDSAGEQRVTGNIWRAWGYVDTVDEKNVSKREQWTVEMEFQGGTKWKLRGIAFGEK